MSGIARWFVAVLAALVAAGACRAENYQDVGQWGLHHLGDSVRQALGFVAWGIAFAGLAVGAGIYLGLREARRSGPRDGARPPG